MNISPSTSTPVYLNVPSNMHGVVISNQSDVAVVLQTNYHKFTIPEFCAYTNECAPGDELEFIANANATTGMVEVNFYETHLQTSIVPTKNIIQSNVNPVTVDTSPTSNSNGLLINETYTIPANGYIALPVLDVHNYNAISISSGNIADNIQLDLYFTPTSDPSSGVLDYKLYIASCSTYEWTFPVILSFVQIYITTNYQQTINNFSVFGLCNSNISTAYQYINVLASGYNVTSPANNSYNMYLQNYFGPATLTIQLPIQAAATTIEILLVGQDYTNKTQYVIADFNITGSTTAPVQQTINLNVPPAVCLFSAINKTSTNVTFSYYIATL